MIKAVLFDMDGVLYDSMKNHAVAWVQSMQKFGINMTADDAYHPLYGAAATGP